MIKYTAIHSTGLIKTRTSKGHTVPRYTHALWVKSAKPTDFRPHVGKDGWECVSIGQERTVRYEDERYARAGYETEVVEVIAQ